MRGPSPNDITLAAIIAAISFLGSGRRYRNPAALVGTPPRRCSGRHTMHAQQSARLIRGRFRSGPVTPDAEVEFKHLHSVARRMRSLRQAMEASQ